MRPLTLRSSRITLASSGRSFSDEGIPVDPQLELEHLPEPVGRQVVAQRLDRHPLDADDALRAAVVVLHTVADAPEDHDEIAGRLGQDPGSEQRDDRTGQDGPTNRVIG